MTDGLGRRIRKTVDPGGENDTDYDYYYNAWWQVLEVRRDQDTYEDPLKRYVWSVPARHNLGEGGRYIDEPVVRFYDGDTDGSLSGGSDNTLYYCVDANQNVTTLATTSGPFVQEVERYHYDPYGRVHVFDGDWQVRTTDVYDNDILYCGYLLDRELGGLDGSTGELYGLYHVRHRVYDPLLGRWLQRDPVGYRDSMNAVEYVRSMPTRGVDPHGLYGPETHYGVPPDGLYGPETHYQGTARIAVETVDQVLADQGLHPAADHCFPMPETIARWDQGADEDGHDAKTALLNRNAGDYDLHFTGAGLPCELFFLDWFGIGSHLCQTQREVVPGLANVSVARRINRAVAACDVAQLGFALHALQDSHSHRGRPSVGGHPAGQELYDPNTGELLEGWVTLGLLDTRPDVPAWNPGRQQMALDDTRQVLLEFWDSCARRLCCFAGDPRAGVQDIPIPGPGPEGHGN